MSPCIDMSYRYYIGTVYILCMFTSVTTIMLQIHGLLYYLTNDMTKISGGTSFDQLYDQHYYITKRLTKVAMIYNQYLTNFSDINFDMISIFHGT